MKEKLGCLSVVGALVLLLAAPLGHAQEADEFMLEEITVTAQKREENQQKVAITMGSVAGEDIKESGSNDLEEIISMMSGVFINKAGDGLRVSIRGMSDDITPTGQLENVSNSTPTVAVNTDGVFSSSRQSGSALFDLERVEVLYGPQSTMYASNSPGGIVNIVTANPKLALYEASGTVEYGNYGLLHTEGSLNVPVSDSVAFRSAFSTSSHDGYMANGSDDEDTKAGRFKIMYNPVEAFSFVATAELTRGGGSGYSGIDIFIDEGDLADPWDNSDEELPTGRTSKSEKYTGRIDWTLAFATVTVLPSYGESSQHAAMSMSDSSGDVTTQILDGESSEEGVEVRLSSNADSGLKWNAGFNYYSSESTEFVMPDTGYYQNRYNDQEVYAFFGNLTYPVMETFRLTLGVRQSWDENNTLFEALMENPVSGDIDTVGDATSSEYDSPDFKVGVEYDVSENSMWYADWSTSYRTMSMTLSAADPEELNAYTIGSKNRFMNNRLQLNASAYFYDYTNYLADAGLTDPATGRQDDGSQSNGDLEIYGVDVQTSAVISENDILNLSVSYLHSEFTRLFFDYVSDALVDKDYSGKAKTFSPEWSISLAFKHKFDLSNGGNITASLESKYQSDYFVTYMEEYTEDTDDDGIYELYDLTGYNLQEAHTISNVSAIYSHPDGKWTLTAYVKNLENYAEKKNLMMGTMMIGVPRTYGAVLSVRF